MAKAKQKYYVVWKGHMPGIYTSWPDCQKQITDFPGAQYKSFENMAAAEYAIQRNYFEFVKKAESTPSPSPKSQKLNSQIIGDSICVDAACSGNPGLMEYQGVETASKKQIFHRGPYPDGTNNIGEFLGLVHAIAMLHKLGNNHTAIYTDSKTAIAWVRNKKVKTTLEKNGKNAILFELMDRAITWLNAHNYQNRILKWETEIWGEIPADFGRK